MAYNMTDSTKYRNCDLIHPLMQLEVYNLIQFLRHRGLKKLVVFGSSTMQDRCHVWSDLDIYVEGCTRDDIDEYQPLRRISIDALFPHIVGKESPIRKQIEQTGVCVYG